ncbi:uncharacterized membrane protein YcaP (DUF421 family) [Deinobacterium chartae]|uniref:Uncharacterized membrane protein YcaP (DUF421 family) n=1 Tax=Deinobacterium chartae TaxID=521158 RepID=A0A841HT88_9DEIO|nr:YetF domain-containing protein [Deinobacterium chartae]MBB6096621.1 uncharacterized membrane protein YcaP (DUF421 family) [Deinobacterium chartae]
MDVDWAKVLLPSTPLLEIIVRGSVTYLALFVLLRMVLKRESTDLSVTDLLVVVLIADAAQNGMAGGAKSVTDSVVLVAVILFWSYLLDWLGYHFPRFQRWVRPPPLPLVRDGRMLLRNMRRELITEDELMSQLRQQGIESLEAVRLACMEGDGRISVITRRDRA